MKTGINHARICLISMLIIIFVSGCGAPSSTSYDNAAAPQAASQMAPSQAPAPQAPAPLPQTETGVDMSANNKEAVMEESTAYENVSGEIGANEPQIREEKRIKEANMDAKTKEFDVFIDSLKNTVKGYGGYVESYNSYVYDTRNNKDLKSGNIILRVPVESYDSIIEYIKSEAKVTRFSDNDVSVTDQYYDIEARMNTKLIQEQRLLAMIEKAEKIEDLISLEQSLADVREVVEMYKSQINAIDSKVKYSSVTVNITETANEQIEAISDDFWSQIKYSFYESANATIRFFENILVFIAGITVQLAVILLSALIIFIMYRKRKKKNGNRD